MKRIEKIMTFGDFPINFRKTNAKYCINLKIFEIFSFNSYKFLKYFDKIFGKLQENFKEI